MTQESKPDQTGAAKEPVKQEEASNDRKPGELSIEELAKVSGGRMKLDNSVVYTNNPGFAGTLKNTFTKG